MPGSRTISVNILRHSPKQGRKELGLSKVLELRLLTRLNLLFISMPVMLEPVRYGFSLLV
uniref:Uncharacterized protein n=1 Tax=Utricularia reniformis TaxID=192314 RepID=A0A1Y0B140_9LAMI|nr:hypothetical protein AEK19_MT0837 [Utricularia reniformis]YP_009382300.1 hypothetical protein AEK19_MT1872 [Utricularia reniformis]ART31069.1 hypothetical protein AEK19_MT0837 [Utricularia reniformis]ART32042.1 hypothetical protein AEK19_MT1872 [Utricularia reniformis]